MSASYATYWQVNARVLFMAFENVDDVLKSDWELLTEGQQEDWLRVAEEASRCDWS